MTGEIDRDFYCSGSTASHACALFKECQGKQIDCTAKHRKWPTPEQYKAEYGRDVPEDFPVWYREDLGDSAITGWDLWEYRDKRDFQAFPETQIVIACTPWGKPPDDWRTE